MPCKSRIGVYVATFDATTGVSIEMLCEYGTQISCAKAPHQSTCLSGRPRTDLWQDVVYSCSSYMDLFCTNASARRHRQATSVPVYMFKGLSMLAPSHGRGTSDGQGPRWRWRMIFRKISCMQPDSPRQFHLNPDAQRHICQLTNTECYRNLPPPRASRDVLSASSKTATLRKTEHTPTTGAAPGPAAGARMTSTTATTAIDP